MIPDTDPPIRGIIFVDIVLKLGCFGKLKCDRNRRRLIALSRTAGTPDSLAFEWNPATGVFSELTDPYGRRYEENWSQLQVILAKREIAVTHHELLKDWPADDEERPSPSTLYEWLNRAFEQKRIRREGYGTRTDPWRYRLENEDDEYYERGELPPLKDVSEILRGMRRSPRAREAATRSLRSGAIESIARKTSKSCCQDAQSAGRLHVRRKRRGSKAHSLSRSSSVQQKSIPPAPPRFGCARTRASLQRSERNRLLFVRPL